MFTNYPEILQYIDDPSLSQTLVPPPTFSNGLLLLSIPPLQLINEHDSPVDSQFPS